MKNKEKEDVSKVEPKELPVPKGIMGYEAEERPAFKLVDTPSKIKALARSFVRGCFNFVLRRSPVVLLVEALDAKLGKPATKSEIVRHGIKRYNEGYQKAIKDNEEKWL